jgi:hypothetical protein
MKLEKFCPSTNKENMVDEILLTLNQALFKNYLRKV